MQGKGKKKIYQCQSCFAYSSRLRFDRTHMNCSQTATYKSYKFPKFDDIYPCLVCFSTFKEVKLLAAHYNQDHTFY